MTVRQIERIIEVAKEPHVHGKWSRFCLSEGLTKDAVFHWRKKLGLPMKPPPSATPAPPSSDWLVSRDASPEARDEVRAAPAAGVR